MTGASSEQGLRRQYLCDEIFGGDDDAVEAMEAASNGFEHGYMRADDVRAHLEPVLERSMSLVRRALITQSGVAPDIQDRLLIEDYDGPRGLVPVRAFVRGELVRTDLSLPAEEMDGAAVELEWNDPAPIATRSGDGQVSISFPYEITVRKLPPNATLNTFGFGMRPAYVRRGDEPLDVKVKRAAEAEPDGEAPSEEGS